MITRKIMLTQDLVSDFVNAAGKCDFDVDISYNRYIVDAKSFLGVYGMDFSKVLTVSYCGYNAEFEGMLQRLAVAC